jgi:hypothetical protein
MGMRAMVFRLLYCFGLVIVIQRSAAAARLTAETLAAWDEQVRTARAQVERESKSPQTFMTEAAVRFLVESPEPSGCPVPDGLIHHWFGTELIPHARASGLLSVLQRYDAYAEVFPPVVVEARLLNRDGPTFDYHLKFIQKGLGVRSGLLADFRSRYVQVDAKSGYIVTESLKLIELQSPGKPDERQLSLAESKGFVERSFTLVRYRETDQGVLIRMESMMLSRDVPSSIRWLVSPFIHKFARQTMSTTLERIKDRVCSESDSSSVAKR